MIRHPPPTMKKKNILIYLLQHLSQFHLSSVATIYESKLRTLRNTNKIPSIFSNTCQLNHKFKNKKRNETFTFSVTAKIKEKVLPSHCHWCKVGEREGGKEGRKKINKINCVHIRILFHSIVAQEEEYFHFFSFFFLGVSIYEQKSDKEPVIMREKNTAISGSDE